MDLIKVWRDARAAAQHDLDNIALSLKRSRMVRGEHLMDFKDQPESIQHTTTSDEDIHEQKSYPTDLTDAQWQRIAPLLPPGVPNGHQHKVEPREVVNGVVYVVCGSHD